MAKIDEIVDGLIDSKLQEQAKGAAARIEKAVQEDFIKKLNKEFGATKKVKITLNGKNMGDAKGLTHKTFEKIIRYIAANISVILVGPAGSGKTQVAVQCAEVLKRKHYSISVNEHTSKTDFMGYMDANGKLVVTNFRKAFEEGGVFIIDEIDAANPNILTIINSALSNGFCPFPDGMVERHADFMCICTANTFGEGESAHYIGRNALDAATRDRFATLHVDYDENIEKFLNDGNVYHMASEIRKYFKDNKVDFVVSTRGMLRLTQLTRIEDYKITKEDVKNCLNLHTTVNSAIDAIIAKYT